MKYLLCFDISKNASPRAYDILRARPWDSTCYETTRSQEKAKTVEFFQHSSDPLHWVCVVYSATESWTYIKSIEEIREFYKVIKKNFKNAIPSTAQY